MDIKQLYNLPAITLLFGAPRSGKTHALKHIMTEAFSKKLFNFGLLFSITAKYSGDFDFLPDKYIIDGYDEETLRRYITKLKDWRIEHNKKVAPPNFIIFDDVVGSLVVSNYFKEFMTTHRHTSTSVFIATQYPTQCCGVVAREIINYALIYKQNSEQANVNIYKSIGGYLPKKDFFVILDNATKEKHSCLFFNSTCNKKKYSKFKAPKNIKKMKVNF